MKLRERDCPICLDSLRAQVAHEADYALDELDEFGFASRKRPEFMHFELRHCEGCDVLFASPVPDADWFDAAYADAAFAAGAESEDASHTYAAALCQLLPSLPSRDGALDIGAGDGAFLKRLLELGFSEVVGIEPSAAPREQADPEVRDLLRPELVRGAEPRDSSVALVSCFQTLEHLDDPLALCRRAYRALAPGGAFLAVVHSHRSLQARLLGTRSPIFDVEHLQLFSPQSIAALLSKAGFERIEVRPLRNDYALSYWLRLLPLGDGLRALAQRLLAATGLEARRVGVRAGNLVVSGFKARG